MRAAQNIILVRHDISNLWIILEVPRSPVFLFLILAAFTFRCNWHFVIIISWENVHRIGDVSAA